MGESLYHPWHMAHEALREMAFQMRSEDLRKYGQELLIRKPDRIAAAEVLDLMAYLVGCDFIGAEAKLSTVKFKFDGTPDEAYVEEATSLALAHIDFAFGRFDDLEKVANRFLEKHRQNPTLEEGEYLDVLRLLAQKAILLDQFDRVEEIYEEMASHKKGVKATNLLYLVNSVKALALMARGEAIKANQIARQNIEIAKQNKYAGLMAPIDSLYVLSKTLLAFSQKEEALKVIAEVKNLAEQNQHWPWYFTADGSISQEEALANRITESLALVRAQREKMMSFNFKHNLSYLADANELFVRFVLKDQERMDQLINRLPELHIVKQVRPFRDQWNNKDLLTYIEKLPDRTPREKLYKYMALAGYFNDKESIAIDYMSQVLPIIEETGFIEYILRQFELFDLILKTIAKHPTPFLEDLASKITERIQMNSVNIQGGIPEPLTTRELEVVRNLASGKPISSIAGTLHVSLNTMKTHLRNIYRKLDVDGRDSAVLKAKELFII